MERKDAIWLVSRLAFLYIVYWVLFFYKLNDVPIDLWLRPVLESLAMMGILLAAYVLVVLSLVSIKRRLPRWLLYIVEISFLCLMLHVVLVYP